MFAELLRQCLGSTIELSAIQVMQLEQHFELLNKWNKTINLTSIHDPRAMVERHYCESLFLGTHLPKGRLAIADVGSGAGFPGIPVAILRPDCSLALVESHRRKCAFLREATHELPNVRVIAERVEVVSGSFEWATSRAVNYSDIEIALGKLAQHVAILGGQVMPNRQCFTWNTPIQLPWGRQRYLWLGSRRST